MAKVNEPAPPSAGVNADSANDPSRHLSESSKFFAGGSLALSAGGSGAPSALSSARESADT
jgi:hypothetical protein